MIAQLSLSLVGRRKGKEKEVLYACKPVALTLCAAQTSKAAASGRYFSSTCNLPWDALQETPRTQNPFCDHEGPERTSGPCSGP